MATQREQAEAAFPRWQKENPAEAALWRRETDKNTGWRRHQWLVDALRDRGLQQSDLARVWGISASAVSRIITGGPLGPPLDLPRMQALSSVLSVDANTLLTMIGRPAPVAAPSPVESPRVDAPPLTERTEECDEAVRALNTLRDAVDHARRVLPHGCRIDVSINYPGLTNQHIGD